jgi:hypothetical protein
MLRLLIEALLGKSRPLIVAEYDPKFLSIKEAQAKADEMERKSGHPVIIIPVERMNVRRVLP